MQGVFGAAKARAMRAGFVFPIRWRAVWLGVAVVAASSTVALQQASASTSRARASDASNVPYTLPVASLPNAASSPPVDAGAPYTPAVLNLIAQLEPGSLPTEAELTNADAILHDGPNSTCHNVGPVAAPTGTSPSITPLCWTDAQGVNVTSGPNAAMTTAPMDLMGLGATFDRTIANVWGQAEGTEGRELMVTGLFGPQTDIDRTPDWGRNLTTTGADPYLSGQLVAAQINGVQGAGLMAEMKHFAAYDGQDQSTNNEVQDQALHQIYLAPYEAGFVNAQAAATMCSYALWQDTASTLPASVSSLASIFPLSPYGASSQQTWPLDESHQACEQPLTLTYALRDLWGSKAMVGTDYGASYSTSSINQGEQQEMPQSTGNFSASNTPGSGFGGPPDPTGDTCASATGTAESCTTPGAVHLAGIPGPGCPPAGCTLVEAVDNGTVSLSAFNQALATILYQEQRFGLLGCTSSPVASTCTNTLGINGNQTGTAPLPTGPNSGATPKANLGTEGGDAAVAELEAEEGGVLLKNDSSTLPITHADLHGSGVLVTGPGAQYTIADPTTEASVGYQRRDTINPLQQLEAFSGDSSALSYDPALDPVGEPVPSSALSTSSSTVTGDLAFQDNGASTTAASVNYTTASPHGPLAPGNYSWSGYVYVPTNDTYTLDFQFSKSVAAPASQAVSATSWASGTATLTVPSGTPAPVGSEVDVSGACPSGYNGNYTVTASTATSVSYALGSDPGSCNESLAVTNASWQAGFSFPPFFSAPSTATLNYASTSAPPALGSSITVTGVSPSGYDGTFTVTASTPTSVTYNLATNPGSYTGGGSVAVSSAGTAAIGDIHVSFNGAPVALKAAAAVNSTATGIPGSPTNAGYTEAGLTNMQYSAGALTGGTYYPITVSFDNSTAAPASFRFGYNRANGDIADAAAAAKGKSMAIVFVDDTGAPPEGNTPTALTMVPNPNYDSSQPVSDSNPPYISGVESLPANQTQLVQAVAAANPNTVVVVNSTDPVLMPWIANVKSVLEMWYSGGEGGTATARLLLGQADPSGHLPITFPANATDTIWGYNETEPLYGGDTLGTHLERLNGNGGCSASGYNCPPDSTTVDDEGIFTDYRFFDKEGITPLFPFGWGLSYTTFAYSDLGVAPASDGGLNVTVKVTNSGAAAGTAAPQVYLGAPSSPPAGIQFAVRQLAQFSRVSLAPGQTKHVTLHVALRQLQYWSAANQEWQVANGDRTVYVGDADATSAPSGDPTAATSLPLQTTVQIGGNDGTTSTLTCDDEQLSATVVSGNVMVPGGDWCDVIDTTVTGNLMLGAGSVGLRVTESTVDGNITSTGTVKAADPLSAGSDMICSTTVKGTVSILLSGKTVPWNLGQCGGDTIGGNVTFAGNAAAGNSITGTSVAGNLSCVADGSVTTGGNTVTGRTSAACR
jgi:hypothetical protein